MNYRKMLKIKPTDKICIIRSAFLGDWITTVPFYIYLINDCRVKKENISTVLLNNKGSNSIENILGTNSVLGNNTYIINSQSVFTSLKSAYNLRKKLFNEFDKIIFLPFTFENRISRFKKLVISYVFAHIYSERFGFDILTFKTIQTHPSQYISYFKKLGIQFKIDFDAIKRFLISELVELKSSKDRQGLKIAIYAHSKLEMKIWDQNNFTQVILALDKKYKPSFILIGSKDDFQYNETLISKLPNDINISNIAGSISIRETLTLLSDINLLITNDGAPVHFASLLNLPTVAIYTYKEPIGAWDPFLSSQYIAIRTDVECKHCYKEFCSNPVCIKSIGIVEVLDSCIELLEHTDTIHRQNKILISDSPLHFKKSVDEK